VGRVAFKKGATSLDGSPAFALPSCIASFHLPSPQMGSARVAFGSPTASPRRWSPKTVTTSLMVGRSKSGCDLGPALSFKDLHHPCWGGGRGEPGPAFTWAGVPLLPLASGGGNHPLALRRRCPPAVPGKANCCCPVQGAAIRPLSERQWPAAPGGLTTRRTPRGRYSCSGMVPFSF
jgi:hypothetical protein